MRTQRRIREVQLSNGPLAVRSTLEGRWAIFFDTLGLKWKYEPERVSGYLPDFRVTGLGLIEIKPTIELLAQESEAKMIAFCRSHPDEKLYAFCSGKVGFTGVGGHSAVAMYQGDKIFAVPPIVMDKEIASARDPQRMHELSLHRSAITYAARAANAYKFSDWVSIGATLRFAHDEVLPRP